MRRVKMVIASIVLGVLFASATCACLVQNTELGDTSSSAQSKGEINMKLLIDNVEVPVDWEDNESVRQILSIASTSDLIVNAHRYGGFEQVGEIGQNIVSENVQMTTEPGDIVLYNDSNIVLFYGNNSWSYTKLGKIVGKTDEELKNLLNKNSVVLKIK